MARLSAAPVEFPGSYDFAAMEAVLQAAAEAPHARLYRFGQSVEGRPLWAIEFLGPDRGLEEWRVLFIGLQHGNEPAGRDALVVLAKRLAEDQGLLAPNVRLVIAPNVNPDGGERDARRNANDFDLNRDHILLSQPETRAMHALARGFQPHITMDAHEFTRDPIRYTRNGLDVWPLIMMDTANNPLMPAFQLEEGVRWVDAARPALEAAGFNYERYHVGGPPPFVEIRPSTLESDDARNGLGMHGGLSFIIESGVLRSAPDPDADLRDRVHAYLLLLAPFLDPGDRRDELVGAIDAMRAAPMPASIPTNVFWGSLSTEAGEWPAIDQATGQPIRAAAFNRMDARVVKTRVPSPDAYAIDPAHADAYAELLDAHGLPFERLRAPREVVLERVRLLDVEEGWDPLYSRFDGRQITEAMGLERAVVPAGALWVPVEGHDGRRAAVVIEPQRLYGLYRWPQWRATVDEDGVVPVWRVRGPVAGEQAP